ncbi:MAG: hypothetical protein NTU53_16755 [Planctomycetota bacterium]|nr:hypothetical protein [Planctomycetota bacterium]
MGIREKLNENPLVAGSLVGVVVILAGVWIYLQNRSPSLTPAAAAKSTFYTEDDGKTYFPGDYANLAKDFKGPKGKDAVRAYVFRHGKGDPFVAYMEKYAPAGKQALATFYSDPANQQKPPPPEVFVESLVKTPGQKAWVSMKDRAQASPIRRTPVQADQEADPVTP